MTEPLYLDNSTVREFEARIERVIDDGKTSRITLDRTHFYPEGGGQPADRGIISGTETWAVRDVRKSDKIYHTVEGDGPSAGETVRGELDWERRYNHMRYHTAQHLLSAILLAEFDALTTGNQLYVDHAHLDCAYERFSDGELSAIEDRMNELVLEQLDVQWHTLDREQAEANLDPQRTRLDLLPDSITEVRIVEIDDFDRVACAGTHVSNTEEIGRISVTGRETKGANEERIEFVIEDE